MKQRKPYLITYCYFDLIQKQKIEITFLEYERHSFSACALAGIHFFEATGGSRCNYTFLGIISVKRLTKKQAEQYYET